MPIELRDDQGRPELARAFHENAVRSLPDERAGELTARTLAFLTAQSVEDLTALLTSAGALRSRHLPLPDCAGQVGHPLRRLRADMSWTLRLVTHLRAIDFGSVHL